MILEAKKNVAAKLYIERLLSTAKEKLGDALGNLSYAEQFLGQKEQVNRLKSEIAGLLENLNSTQLT